MSGNPGNGGGNPARHDSAGTAGTSDFNQGPGRDGRFRGGRGGQQNRGTGGAANSGQNNRFKGACEELKDHVYDAGAIAENQDLFTNTTEAIAEYVAKHYEAAGEFRLGLVKMELDDIDAPSPPVGKSPTLAEVEMYKLDLKEYKYKVSHRDRNMQKIFPLILGQCSDTIRDRLKGAPEWKEINAESKVMDLVL